MVVVLVFVIVNLSVLFEWLILFWMKNLYGSWYVGVWLVVCVGIVVVVVGGIRIVELFGFMLLVVVGIVGIVWFGFVKLNVEVRLLYMVCCYGVMLVFCSLKCVLRKWIIDVWLNI